MKFSCIYVSYFCREEQLVINLKMEHLETEEILQGDNVLDQLENIIKRTPDSISVSTEKFMSMEHENIGNKVKLQFPHSDDDETLRGSRRFGLQLPNELMLTFGQIIALAGDFYGVPEHPIVDPTETEDTTEAIRNRRSRFISAYNTLARAEYKNIKKELDEILKIMTIESDEIEAVLYNKKGMVAVADKDGKNVRVVPKDVYDKLGNSLTEKWDEITGGTWILGIPIVFGRIMELAENNHDHFLPFAKDAYLAGHELALDKAREASGADDHNTTRRLLDEAYSMDAFACHFLTDSFSSGHVRIPRLELGKHVTPSKLGHFLCKCMHDEDNKYGLRVRNRRGDKWVSYGDGMLLQKESDCNYKIAVQAVQMSVNQVYNAFLQPKEPIYSTQVTDYIPFVDPDAKNNHPLFQVKEGKLLRRGDLGDLSDASTENKWSAAITAWTLKSYKPEKSAIEESHYSFMDCRGCSQSFHPMLFAEMTR